MRAGGLWLLIGAGVWAVGCRNGTACTAPKAAPGPGAEENGSSSVTLQSQTFETLLLYDSRVLATVRCDKAEVFGHGRRSEKVWIDATVVEIGEGQPPSPWRLSRYTTGGNPIMEAGVTYLVAAFEEAADQWRLVECVRVDEAGAAAALAGAVQTLRERAAE